MPERPQAAAKLAEFTQLPCQEASACSSERCAGRPGFIQVAAIGSLKPLSIEVCLPAFFGDFAGTQGPTRRHASRALNLLDIKSVRNQKVVSIAWRVLQRPKMTGPQTVVDTAGPASCARQHAIWRNCSSSRWIVPAATRSGMPSSSAAMLKSPQSIQSHPPRPEQTCKTWSTASIRIAIGRRTHWPVIVLTDLAQRSSTDEALSGIAPAGLATADEWPFYTCHQSHPKLSQNLSASRLCCSRICLLR